MMLNILNLVVAALAASHALALPIENAADSTDIFFVRGEDSTNIYARVASPDNKIFVREEDSSNIFVREKDGSNIFVREEDGSNIFVREKDGSNIFVRVASPDEKIFVRKA
ncbi:hypothetical protein BD413DRAFT_492450 [Trametes elegans]|nr:hypothetical protein BD413DRAFT_492450 [Trametes elegans]